MPHIHWVARQNKLEIPRDKDEVKQREIRRHKDMVLQHPRMWHQTRFYHTNFNFHMTRQTNVERGRVRGVR